MSCPPIHQLNRSSDYTFSSVSSFFLCVCVSVGDRKFNERLRLNTPVNEHSDSRKCRHISQSFEQKG